MTMMVVMMMVMMMATVRSGNWIIECATQQRRRRRTWSFGQFLHLLQLMLTACQLTVGVAAGMAIAAGIETFTQTRGEIGADWIGANRCNAFRRIRRYWNVSQRNRFYRSWDQIRHWFGWFEQCIGTSRRNETAVVHFNVNVLGFLDDACTSQFVNCQRTNEAAYSFVLFVWQNHIALLLWRCTQCRCMMLLMVMSGPAGGLWLLLLRRTLMFGRCLFGRTTARSSSMLEGNRLVATICQSTLACGFTQIGIRWIRC